MSTQKEGLETIFEDYPVRRVWDATFEKWYFSVVDIVGILIEQQDHQKARKYWNKLKERLHEEGSQLVTNCHQLKLIAEDGKKRITDAADVEIILRLIQSVPSNNLRDHMSEAELIFSVLAELSTRQIAENVNAQGFVENQDPARKGGKIAKDAKKALEEKTGQKVVSSGSYLESKAVLGSSEMPDFAEK